MKSVKFLLDIYQYIVQINDVLPSDSDNTDCLPALEGGEMICYLFCESKKYDFAEFKGVSRDGQAV